VAPVLDSKFIANFQFQGLIPLFSHQTQNAEGKGWSNLYPPILRRQLTSESSQAQATPLPGSILDDGDLNVSIVSHHAGPAIKGAAAGDR
jgi:hypothetical protein